MQKNEFAITIYTFLTIIVTFSNRFLIAMSSVSLFHSLICIYMNLNYRWKFILLNYIIIIISPIIFKFNVQFKTANNRFPITHFCLLYCILENPSHDIFCSFINLRWRVFIYVCMLQMKTFHRFIHLEYNQFVKNAENYIIANITVFTVLNASNYTILLAKHI